MCWASSGKISSRSVFLALVAFEPPQNLNGNTSLVLTRLWSALVFGKTSHFMDMFSSGAFSSTSRFLTVELSIRTDLKNSIFGPAVASKLGASGCRCTDCGAARDGQLTSGPCSELSRQIALHGISSQSLDVNVDYLDTALRNDHWTGMAQLNSDYSSPMAPSPYAYLFFISL